MTWPAVIVSRKQPGIAIILIVHLYLMVDPSVHIPHHSGSPSLYNLQRRMKRYHYKKRAPRTNPIPHSIPRPIPFHDLYTCPTAIVQASLTLPSNLFLGRRRQLCRNDGSRPRPLLVGTDPRSDWDCQIAFSVSSFSGLGMGRADIPIFIPLLHPISSALL